MEYQRELLKGNTDSLLLSLLDEQPMYGYQLIKEIGNRCHLPTSSPSFSKRCNAGYRVPSLKRK